MTPPGSAEKIDDAAIESLDASFGRRRWRSWRAMLGGSLLLAAGILALAPWLLTHTGGLARLLKAAPIPGVLRIGSASLAWWSPVMLQDVELLDEHGELLAKIDRVSSEKTLFSLVTARTNLGRIAVEHPALRLATREGGSNLEDFLAALHAPAGSAATAPLLVELDVTGGEATIQDTLAQRQFHLSSITLALKSAGGARGSLDATLSANIATDKALGSLAGELHASAAGVAGSAKNVAGRDEAGAMPDAPAGSSATVAEQQSAAAPREETPAPPGNPPSPASGINWIGDVAASRAAGSPAASAAASPLAVGRFQFQVSGAPLAMFQPFLRRALAGAQIDGQVVAKASGSWGEGDKHQRQSLDADLLATDFALSAPALGQEVLQLDQVHIPGRITHDGVAIGVENLSLECNVGQLSASGQLRVAELNASQLLATLAKQSFKLDGQLDVARLAKLLPATLRIRDGVQITAGQVTLSASGSPAAASGEAPPDADGPQAAASDQPPRADGQSAPPNRQPAQANGQWQARLEGSNLAALDHGQQFTWQAPLVMEITGHDGPRGPVIDAAKVDASFLHAQAAGAANNLSGDASFDLARLATEAAQFVNLGALQLGGSGSVNFAWRQAADQTFALRASIEAKALQVALPERPAWIEPALSGELDVRGAMSGATIARVDRGSLEILGNQERLLVALANPAVSATDMALQVTWQGPVNGWTGRLALWFDVAGWELSGEGALGGEVLVAGQRISFQQVNLKADRAHVWLPGFYFDEQQLTLTGACVWDIAHHDLQVPNLVLLAGQAGARVTNLHCFVGADGSSATSGQLAYKAEVGQILRWTRDPRQASQLNLTGQASGGGRLELAAGVSTLDFTGVVDNLQASAAVRSRDAAGPPVQNVSQSAPIAWREQQLKLAVRASYDHAKDLLTIAQVELTGAALRAAVAGAIASLNTQRTFDIKGEVEYDWAQLAPLIQPYVGARVAIDGHETRPFNLQGSWPVDAASPEAQWQQLTGGGGLGWSRADVYGLPIGPGQLAAVLSRGIVQFQPLDLTVSGGMVHFNEQWRILPAPGELRMAKGLLVEKIDVTPEICRQALQYVAPILAQVTRSEGTFSVDIEGGKLTFGSGADCDVAGHLLTDQAHVQAGPVAQQFALLADRIGQLVLSQSTQPVGATAVLVNLNNEQIDFRVVGGRVYHRNLRFKIGILEIITQGSVGFDDSLEMLAEVALSESLLADRPLLKQVFGHPLQIPLTGSLGAPRLDTRVLEELIGQTARTAAREAITRPLQTLEKPIQSLEKPLENLIRP